MGAATTPRRGGEADTEGPREGEERREWAEWRWESLESERLERRSGGSGRWRKSRWRRGRESAGGGGGREE